jgi:transposase
MGRQEDFVPYVTFISSSILAQPGQVSVDIARVSVIVTAVTNEYSLDKTRHTVRIMIDTMPRRRPPAPEDPKVAALRTAGALHPRPDALQDPAFASHEFFDRRDRVQVKYEMLRRHRVDGRPVTEVAGAFGVSRQAFYATETAFTAAGLPGLLPRPRGPQRAHKCTDPILDFVEQRRADDPSPSAAAVAEAVRQQFGIAIHPRSLARALGRRKKNRTPRGRPPRDRRRG